MRQWLLAIFIPLCLHAGGWDPVPPETWAIKPDSTLGASGAVILIDSYRFGTEDTERRMRVLVLNDAGKTAVQIDPFSPHLSKLEGRILYPDGREMPFDKAKDFTTQTLKLGSGEINRQVLVPPGVTDHCILDIHWIDRGTYLWGSGFNTRILRPFPIEELTIRLSKRSPLASVWLVPKDIRPVITEERDYHLYTFKDLPAREVSPYSYEAFRFDPQLRCFQIPASLGDAVRNPGLAFWAEFTTKFVRTAYGEEIKAGKAYKTFAKELLDGLPSDPVERAVAIQDRLNGRILNISELTYTEKQARGEEYEKATVDYEDLDQAVERKWTVRSGMFDLLYELYQDAGLHPKLLFVSSKEDHAFMFDVPDWHQLDVTLLGVSTLDGNGTWWTNGARFAPPGVISSYYQGTEALLVDTSDWSLKTVKVPIQLSSITTNQISCEVTPGEDADAFKINAVFTGGEDWAERSPFIKLSDKEGQEKLKKEIERTGSLTLTHETLSNVGARGKNFGWEVEGASEPEGGRKRKVNPFPGTDCPFWIPANWPEHRVDPVVLSVPAEDHWTSRVAIPEGWKFGSATPIDRSNSYGSVRWKAEVQAGSKIPTVVVSLDIVAQRLMGPASSEAELRDFLAWVEEAWRRRLAMERAQ